MSIAAERIALNDLEHRKQSHAGICFHLVSFLAIMALLAKVVIPLLKATGRRFAGIGVPGAANWVQHLTLWLGLLGGILAT